MFQPPPDDESWFKALLKGDQKAYRYFFDKHVGYVKMRIQYIVKDEPIADELTSETFQKVWDYRLWAMNPDHLRDILYITAKLLTLIYLISQKDEELDSYLLGQLYYGNEPADGDRRKADRLEQIHQRAEKLPERQKEVFELHYDKGFSHDKIARMLKISPNTVRNHLAKALKFLKDCVYREHLILFVILLLAIKKPIIIW